jgi:hypothetical protein
VDFHDYSLFGRPPAVTGSPLVIGYSRWRPDGLSSSVMLEERKRPMKVAAPGGDFITIRNAGEIRVARLGRLDNGIRLLVTIFSSWEDHYRGKIAEFLRKSKDEMIVPIMGDIRHLRNSIVHHNGVALPELERCEVLLFFKPGDKILITFEHMERIMSEVEKGLQTLFHRSLMVG